MRIEPIAIRGALLAVLATTGSQILAATEATRTTPAEAVEQAGEAAATTVRKAQEAVAGAAEQVGKSVQSVKESDVWIEATLTTSYGLNNELSLADIDIDVSQGKVTLAGKVDNELQRELAVEIARGTEGVDQVINRLEVTQTGRPQTGTATGTEGRMMGAMRDATASARVRLRLLWNTRVSLVDMDVHTKNGITTLTGVAGSEEEKRLADEIARTTQGVHKVRNELRVAPKEQVAQQMSRQTNALLQQAGDEIDDMVLHSRIAFSLTFDNQLDATGIDIQVVDKVVHLEGRVSNEAQRERARKLVESIDGVARVESNLEVAAASAPSGT